ncbi:MAG: hypothetical protein LBR74_07025 [Eubacterium sp.]|nr:hypothetical protein [Eubacterium sp.]
MKTLIVFYSYSGRTKALVQSVTPDKHCDVAEIKDIRRPGLFKAFIMGCPAAIKGKAWPIQSIGSDLSDYDSLILYSPVWAGNPPPAVNALLEQLPKGKAVSVKMLSGSGNSRCRPRIESVINEKGCKMESFENIKT